jgi:hypothetical protein
VRQDVLVVESANIQRFPAFREKLLDGTFMRFTCVGCKASFVAETEMLYTDYEQRLFVGVFPRERRPQVKECEAILESTYEQVFVQEAPSFARVAIGGELHRRVVFGYEELREKVICFGAGLDDHIVEAVKIALTDAQPGIGRLSLQHFDGELLWFAAVVDNAVARLPVRRTVYDAMYEDVQQIQLLLQPLWGGSYVSADTCIAA